MKTAFSIILGEFVEARQVEHADTSPFQIVCPCCKDPVFKVLRPADERNIEYFSHHKKPADLAAECEMRVAGISDASKASENAASRGQSLKAFQSVLRDALALEGVYRGTSYPPEEIRRQFMLGEGVNFFVSNMCNHIVSKNFKDGIESFADHYLGGLSDSGLKLATDFTVAVQRRIAIDLAKHIASPSSGNSRRAIVVHTAINQIKNYILMPDELLVGRPPQAVARKFFRSLPDASERAVYNQLLPMQERVWITAGMENAILGTLMRLPYMPMLRNHRAGRPLLEGIPMTGFTDLLGLENVDPDHSAIGMDGPK